MFSRRREAPKTPSPLPCASSPSQRESRRRPRPRPSVPAETRALPRGPGRNQRYCCMEPEPWIPSAGLFPPAADGKARIRGSERRDVGPGDRSEAWDRFVGGFRGGRPICCALLFFGKPRAGLMRAKQEHRAGSSIQACDR